jgi:uncharacterized phage-associated protein
MSISVLSAAKRICEERDWSVSNLELQKILYIAQMFHLGATSGSPLINENFEAWDYGPVVPELYKHVRGFGSEPVRNVFHWVSDVRDSSSLSVLRDALEATKGMSAGKLVSITHWKNGAWAKCFRPGTRGILIPNELIFEEYRERNST